LFRKIGGVLVSLIGKLLPNESGNIAIAAHDFSSVIYLFGDNIITRKQVINIFGLEIADETQLDQLSNYYDTMHEGEKLAFHCKIEAMTIALQRGFITESQYKTGLGLD